MEHFGIFHFCALSATPQCLVRCIDLEKEEFCHKKFKLGHAPTWKIPHFRYVFCSYTKHEVFFIYYFLCYLRLPNALVFFLEIDYFLAEAIYC